MYRVYDKTAAGTKLVAVYEEAVQCAAYIRGRVGGGGFLVTADGSGTEVVAFDSDAPRPAVLVPAQAPEQAEPSDAARLSCIEEWASEACGGEVLAASSPVQEECFTNLLDYFKARLPSEEQH